jgi:hypothetical protein
VHYMLSFNISYSDLIEFHYFADTTEYRGWRRGWLLCITLVNVVKGEFSMITEYRGWRRGWLLCIAIVNVVKGEFSMILGYMVVFFVALDWLFLSSLLWFKLVK